MINNYIYFQVNRLAVILIQEEKSHILGIPSTENSTRRAEAEMVKDYLDSWGVKDKIIACGFDTTSSNTGVNNGSCTILQNLLYQQRLWLACRHHIMELIIGGAFTKIFGVTSGPEVTTFKILKTSWKTLDLEDGYSKYPPTLKKISQTSCRPRRPSTPRRLQGTPGACQADPWWRD